MVSPYTKRQRGKPPTTNAERLRNFRQRRKAQGLERIQVWVDRETIAGLQRHLRPYEILVHGVARILKQIAEP